MVGITPSKVYFFLGCKHDLRIADPEYETMSQAPQVFCANAGDSRCVLVRPALRISPSGGKGCLIVKKQVEKHTL